MLCVSALSVARCAVCVVETGLVSEWLCVELVRWIKMRAITVKAVEL